MTLTREQFATIIYNLEGNPEVEFRAQFDDVKASDYYSDAVNWAYNNWVTAGKDATHFAPKEPCTREQVVTFLWRSNGSPLVNGESPFDDVRVTNYFFSPVVSAVSNNITAGTGNRLFGVGKACTRAMVVTFLWRNAGSPTVLNGATFSDVSRNDYFYQAVQWAVSKKITAGTGNGRFSPNATCTRGEIVQFLYKYTDGAAIAQPQDFSEAYWPVVANTLRMLNKQSYNANYVADNQDLKNAIGKASGVGVSLIDLDKDGIFVFDFNTVYKYEEVIGDTTIAENREDHSFIWENIYSSEDRINEYDLTIFSREGELFRRSSETHFQRGYTLDDMKSFLKSAHLEFLEARDADTGSEPSETSERIQVVSRCIREKMTYKEE